MCAAQPSPRPSPQGRGNSRFRATFVNPGANCPQKSASFVINLPYRTIAGVTVDGRPLERLPADQLGTAAQGWNQEGTIVRVKIPITKKTLIHMSYTI